MLTGPAAGPFAEPLAYGDHSLVRMAVFGGVLLALIAVHPCWPRPVTAWISGAALVVWFFVGFGYTDNSV